MNRKIFILFSAILLGLSFAPTVRAQQLFVSDIRLKFNQNPTSTGYCDDVVGADPSVDFLTNFVSSDVWKDSSRIEFEKPKRGTLGTLNVDSSYPGGCLGLCAKIQCVVTSTPTTFGVNELDFEIFKFVSGGNPLDPASTPPIKTVSMYDLGTCSQLTGTPDRQTIGGSNHYFCTAWDGSYNLGGIFGKTNGQYGFRATVKTNETSQQIGNISIQQTAAFPGQNQIPIQVDVMNIHTVRSSPTVVGKITGVAAQPYNILYRLSKDATTTISIYSALEVECTPGVNGCPALVPPATKSYWMPTIRTLVNHVPRVGEGTPDGTLTNGDFWDGRDDYGQIAIPGVYRAQIDAESQDYWGAIDNAYQYTTTISHDPLQITDVGVKPLGASSTDQAVVSYLLTESATVYVGIYPPETSFTNGVNYVTSSPPTATKPIIRLITEQKVGRQSVSTIWDGRGNDGNPVCDGDYIYAIWAELASGKNIIRTQRLSVGSIPVARGLVISLISPSSTVIGSSPSVAGLDPFYFRYTPIRDSLITMNILKQGSNTPVRHLITRETRFAGFSNREFWDGKDDNGNFVDDGIYQAELVSDDPYACSQTRITTTTVKFPVSLFHIVDVKTTPLLGGTSDNASISFLLSQPMFITFNVYKPETNIPVFSTAAWPPVVYADAARSVLAEPVFSLSGMRPGRWKITEYWDGYDSLGNLKPDGRYPFTLVASTSSNPGTSSTTDKITGYLDISRGPISFTAFDVIPTIPTMYNSSDTVMLPPYEIDYMVTRQSLVKIQITNSANAVYADVLKTEGETREGGIPLRDFWDGKCNSSDPKICADGEFVPFGNYNVKATARDADAKLDLSPTTTFQQNIEVNPFRIFDMAITPHTLESPGIISYQVSEPMKVVTRIYRPGTTFSGCAHLEVECQHDKLVKMFVGIRPARTQILEYWDGTDLTLSKVPDGNYIFTVNGSADTDNVDSLLGTVKEDGLHEAYDNHSIITNISVASGPSKDDAQLLKDIWFAPNPYNSTAGKFHVPIYANSVLSIRIYNLTGDLIWQYSGADTLAAGTDKWVSWTRTNSAGKLVAPGVYFALIRLEGRDGSKGTFQTVKKILVP